MKYYNIILKLLLFLFSNNLLFAQNNTKAIIIGISEYPNLSAAQQLKFADKDAISFKDFLINNLALDSANVKVFLNKNANKSIYETQIYTLIESAKKDDNLIIYFAGHGAKFKESDNNAFLLMNKVQSSFPYNFSNNDAIDLGDIDNEILNAANKGVNVLLILDACHSGTVLETEKSNEWAMKHFLKVNKNSTKIVSCAAKETSKEGVEWGKGHGVFTYFLLKALTGESDFDTNKKITLFEIKKYLKNNISVQNPQTLGDSSKVIIDLNVLKSNKNDNNYTIKKQFYYSVFKNTRGLKDNKPLTPEINNLIAEYTNAIDSSYLIPHQFLKNQVFKKSKYLKDDSFKFPLGKVVCMASDNQGKRFAIGTDNGFIDWALINYDKQIIFNLDLELSNNKPIEALKFSPNDVYLAAVIGNKIIFIDVETKNIVYEIPAVSSVKSIAFIPNTPYFLYNQQGEIVVFNLDNGKIESKFQALNSFITNIEFNPDFSTMLVYGKDKTIGLFDVKSFKKINNITFKDGFASANFNKNGTQIFVGYNDKHFEVFDLKLNKITNTIKINNKNEKATAHYIKHIPDAGVIVKAGNDWNLEFYEDSLFTFKFSKQILNRGVRNIDFNSRSNVLFVIDLDGNIIKISFTKRPKYAFEILKELNTKPEFSEVKNQFESNFCIALKLRSDTILNHILSGKIEPINTLKIKEAIYELSFIQDFERFKTHKEIMKSKLFLKAEEIIAEKRFAELNIAQDYLDAILALDKDASYSNDSKSIILKMKNELELAKKQIKISEIAAPKYTLPKTNSGKIFMKESRYDSAMFKFQQTIDLEPNKLQGYYHKAQVHLKLGELFQVEKLLQTALSIDKNNEMVYLEKANLDLQRGRFIDAENSLKKSIELNTDYYQSYLELGNFYFMMYKKYTPNPVLLKQAQTNFEKAFLLGTDSPKMFTDEALFYLYCYENKDFAINYIDGKPERWKKNITTFCESALKLNPFCLEAFYILSLNAINENNLNKITELHEKSKKLNDNYSEFYYYEGLLYLKQNEVNKSIDQFEKSIDLDPKNLLAYMELLKIYSKDNSHKFENLVSKLKNKLPNSALANFEIGKYYFVQKNIIKANEYAMNAIKNDPNFSAAKSAILEMNITLAPKDYSKDKIQIITKNILKTKDFISISKLISDNIYFKTDMYSSEIMGDIFNKLETKNNFLIAENQTTPKSFSIFNLNGTEISSNKILNYEFLLPDLLKITSEENLKYLIDGNGKMIFESYFDEISYLKDTELILVEKEGKKGCYNKAKKLVIPIKYKSIKPETKYITKGASKLANYYLTCVEENAGFIHLDKDGKTVK